MRAAHDFAAMEFANFQYVMALHTFDSDPDKEPSPKLHVHLCVKAIRLDGVRLNPRKDDLRRWRERFAERLREHGVACEATPRLHRLQPHRGEKQSIRYKKARGESLAGAGKGRASAERIACARMAEVQQ
jgi:type IV secretory pathway VirD2 relaxase